MKNDNVIAIFSFWEFHNQNAIEIFCNHTYCLKNHCNDIEKERDEKILTITEPKAILQGSHKLQLDFSFLIGVYCEVLND